VTKSTIREGLTTAGLPTDPELVAGLVAEARAYQTRVGVEAALRGELSALGRPVVELPALPEGVTREGLGVLADVLIPNGGRP
jgi:hypothetical protein